MFEQTFKNIDSILFKDSGADSELDYIGQTSWIMFLRYLDELEQEKADEAALLGKKYKNIIEDKYRWNKWAMPKNSKGELDHNKALTGKDLVLFVDKKLFPYLAKFKQKHSENPQTIEYKIGEIFSELENKIRSGYNLREILEYADELPFRSTKDKHELSHLYETKIKNMGNAGRNGGQYYTPRPLIRAMIEVIKPKIGEKIYDGACGSCGFLCEAYDYLTKDREKLSTSDLKTLQTKTFYGKEKKNLAYIIGIMNMILHGIEAPNIIHTNTLSENIRDIQDKERFNIILANPPFGGNERKEVQQNFDIKTGETAFLFLQHFIKYLKKGGRAAIVIKNTFLSNTDNASVTLRKYLLETCNLHTILDMPAGTFLGAGVKTVVLFFTKGQPTKSIWCYQLNAGRKMGKTNSLNDEDMKDFIALQYSSPETKNSWNIKVTNLDKKTYDLSIKNSNVPEDTALLTPQQILEGMQKDNTNDILLNIKILNDEIDYIFANKGKGWVTKRLGEICNIEYGYTDKSTNKGDYRYIRITDIDKNGELILENKKYIHHSIEAETFLLNKNDLLMARTGATFAKVLLFNGNEPSIFASYLIRIKFKEKFENKLYWYFTKTPNYWKQANSLSSGAAQPHFNGAVLKKVIFSYPISVTEQRLLIDKFDKLSSETKKLENIYLKKMNDLDKLKKSILQKIFTDKLVSA